MALHHDAKLQEGGMAICDLLGQHVKDWVLVSLHAIRLLKPIGRDALLNQGKQRTLWECYHYLPKSSLSLDSTYHALSLWTKSLSTLSQGSCYRNPTIARSNLLRLAPPVHCDMPFPRRASTLTRPKIRSRKAKNAYVTDGHLQNRYLTGVATNLAHPRTQYQIITLAETPGRTAQSDL